MVNYVAKSDFDAKWEILLPNFAYFVAQLRNFVAKLSDFDAKLADFVAKWEILFAKLTDFVAKQADFVAKWETFIAKYKGRFWAEFPVAKRKISGLSLPPQSPKIVNKLDQFVHTMNFFNDLAFCVSGR